MDFFGSEVDPPRHFFGCTERIFGDNREPIHIGPVERRHIHLCQHIARQYTSERLIQRNRLRAAWCQVERRAKTELRFIPIQNLKELLLLTHRARLPPRRPRQSPRYRRPRSQNRLPVW